MRRMIVVVDENEPGVFQATVLQMPGAASEVTMSPIRAASTPGEALDNAGSAVDREFARRGWGTTADAEATEHAPGIAE